MAPAPSSTYSRTPTIRPAPRTALAPSSHPIAIRPLPIAISATSTSLVILILIILYHRKPYNANPPHRRIGRGNIRVLSPAVTQPRLDNPYTAPDYSLPMTDNLSAHQSTDRNTTKDSVDTAVNQYSSGASASPSQDTSPVQDYHTYLKDSLRESPPGNALGAGLETSIDSVDHVESRALDNNVVWTAASSDYSVSIDPTPLPSRPNSIHRGQGYGAWARLRLGSEYDGDSTFVPSEANLRLGVGGGNTGWSQL